MDQGPLDFPFREELFLQCAVVLDPHPFEIFRFAIREVESKSLLDHDGFAIAKPIDRS